MASIPTTAGCPAFAYTPWESSPLVDKIVDSGGILMGKANLDQFAAGLVGVRSPYGIPVNPFNPEFVPGGSSSGSGVSVSSNQVAFSLGTDTAGSGRVPASFTNIVGLKPTRGLLSTRGMFPACRSLDCASILALTCSDAWEVFSIIKGFDARDDFSRHEGLPPIRKAKTIRFGFPEGRSLAFFGDTTGAAELYHDARDLLKRVIPGSEFRELEFRPFTDVARVLYRLLFFVGILAGYSFFFGWILEGAQNLGDLFLQDDQISVLAEKMYESFVNWNLGKMQLAKAVLVGIVAYITYVAAFIVYMLFFFARYMILAMLFVLGPVVLAFSVWEVTARFKIWLMLTIQTALWTVVLKFIIAVSLGFALDEIYGSGQANLIFVIAANVLFVYLLIKTPAITSTIVGGASFGFLASDMIHQTTDKTMHALGWIAENMPRYGSRAVEAIRNLSSGEPPVSDPSTGTQMRRDPYGALKRVKSFFGSGDKP